jgi:hypothetical protein
LESSEVALAALACSCKLLRHFLFSQSPRILS